MNIFKLEKSGFIPGGDKTEKSKSSCWEDNKQQLKPQTIRTYQLSLFKVQSVDKSVLNQRIG